VVLGLTQSLVSIAQIAAPPLGGLLIGGGALGAWAFVAALASAAGLVAARWGSTRGPAVAREWREGTAPGRARALDCARTVPEFHAPGCGLTAFDLLGHWRYGLGTSLTEVRGHRLHGGDALDANECDGTAAEVRGGLRKRPVVDDGALVFLRPFWCLKWGRRFLAFGV